MMKLRRIAVTMLVLAMVLAYLPLHTHAQKQRATLTPKIMEQVRTISTMQNGTITFTSHDELVSLCAKAQSNPGKEYVCAFIGGHTLKIMQNLTIPENVAVTCIYDNEISDIEIAKSVTVTLNGHLEGDTIYNWGTLNISPVGTVLAGNSVRNEGETYLDGTIVINTGSSYDIGGRERLYFGETGIVIVNGTLYRSDQFMNVCKEAAYRNNGHWFYIMECSVNNLTFDGGSITIPNNCSFYFPTTLYFGKVDLDLEGYLEISEKTIFNGHLRIKPGALLTVGASVTIDGTLENYGEIAIYSGVDDFNGSLWARYPQEYKDVEDANRGAIFVATKVGEDYPANALVGMDVNSFTVDWLQEDGKSYWILTDYQCVPPATPENPQEVTLIDSGLWDNGIAGKAYWEVYSDGTLKITGEGYMHGNSESLFPWEIYAYMIKWIEVSGVKDIADEAFRDMVALTGFTFGESVTIVGHRSFADCTMLEEVIIPASVKGLGNEVFLGCKALKVVNFAEGCQIKNLPIQGFRNTGITKFVIPDSVTRIYEFDFWDCTHLTEVVVPGSVKKIHEYAFNNCKSLKKITFLGDAPIIYGQAFVGIAAKAYYPWQNETWNGIEEKSFSGNITWVPYCYTHTNITNIEAPDCISPGKIIHTCSACGEIQIDPEQLPPQGHDYGLAEDGKTPDFWDTTCDVCGAERVVDKHRPTHSMYRMYNPNSGEHFYTGSMEERQNLEAVGWKYEGIGFTFPASTGKPVYRLYDEFGTKEHLYTMDEAEKDQLLAQGWTLEGVAFNSGREDEVPQYRLHNPNATIGAYHFTASDEEKDALIAAGWEYQGIGFYTCLQ